jgi:transcription-repair coupling factor (superfamily II helicase)
MRKFTSFQSRVWEKFPIADIDQADIEIIGICNITSATAVICDLISQRVVSGPHVIILPSEKAVDQMQADFQFFAPERTLHRLHGFDVSPFSGLAPSHPKLARRLGWLYQALMATGDSVFIGSAIAFQQKVPAPKFFENQVTHLSPGSSLPADFFEQLNNLGYVASSIVEEPGQYCIKGGIVDIFSPTHPAPVRIELFGQEIESLRSFDCESQLGYAPTDKLTIIPTRECLFANSNRSELCKGLRTMGEALGVDEKHISDCVRQFVRGNYFPGHEFLSPLFNGPLGSCLEYFSDSATIYEVLPDEINVVWHEEIQQHKRQAQDQHQKVLSCTFEELYIGAKQDLDTSKRKTLRLSRIQVSDRQLPEVPVISLRLSGGTDLRRYTLSENQIRGGQKLSQILIKERIEGKRIVISTGSQTQARRWVQILEHEDLQLVTVTAEEAHLLDLLNEQDENFRLLHVYVCPLSESVEFLDDQLLFLNEDSLLPKRSRKPSSTASAMSLAERVFATTDLNIGDFIVHGLHGVGIFEGLKRMEVEGIPSEYIQLGYRDNDKLYIPVYRIGQIQKYAAGHFAPPIDKLGSGSWEKTKIRVKSHLQDIAADLLKLYSQRKLSLRPPLPPIDEDFIKFEASFPFDETIDQERAIADVLSDFARDYPMDRLICGDVGFGKTEVAMRAAYRMVQSGRQVAILAPTTVLSFQHLRTFRHRFMSTPVQIDLINRLVPLSEQKRILEKLRIGHTDIVIGTHRLLSQDVSYKNLGLIVIDEEHRFGVKQKEKLKSLRVEVDCLALSATPIPRTLNMSFLGVRDLSLITTPPSDRHPIRTFLQSYSPSTAARAIQEEVHRGGQVYFIHNRIQSIHGIYAELKEYLPDFRITIAHGQMKEGELEKIMVDFYEGRIDVLLCTTIVESGVDVANANTMLIHDAHTFGLSQLYQLRGRIGRSKERAYCYLLVPPNTPLDKAAQERLQIMQQHTALGSGFYISQHDLELRGAGNLLGEAQSGHVQAVGYELYIELLEDALSDLQNKGVQRLNIDPEMNLRIPALIPDEYISDIRIRLSVYRELSTINDEQDLERMESKLRDQFGKLPVPLVNLLGLMLIRSLCKDLGIVNISSGPKNLTIKVSPQTPIEPMAFLELQKRFPKKYQLASESRFKIATDGSSWASIHSELLSLKNATTAQG